MSKQSAKNIFLLGMAWVKYFYPQTVCNKPLPGPSQQRTYKKSFLLLFAYLKFIYTLLYPQRSPHQSAFLMPPESFAYLAENKQITSYPQFSFSRLGLSIYDFLYFKISSHLVTEGYLMDKIKQPELWPKKEFVNSALSPRNLPLK